MGIRETALGKRRALRWYETLNDEQSADLDTLVKMVQDKEVSASVAFQAWWDHHPNICAGTTFIRYLREQRGLK